MNANQETAQPGPVSGTGAVAASVVNGASPSGAEAPRSSVGSGRVAGSASPTASGGAKNERTRRLKQAVHRHKATSSSGVQERLFTLAFSGLVYPQIWEDPIVDIEALSLEDGDRLVAIASGGCNILSYLTAANISATAIDLNPAHIALNKLKRAAVQHLPTYEAFHRFFAEADAKQNIHAYHDYIRPHLDETTRAYW
ncbi:MAG: DUF3419 family protein, partial [Pseudomonadota bacterium]